MRGLRPVLGWSAIAGMERSQYAKRDSMTRFVLICWLATLMALVACDQAAPTENPASDISVEGSPTATPEPSPTLTSLPEATPTPTENPVSPPSPALEPSSEISPVLQTAEWRGLTVAAEYRCSPYDPDEYSYSQSVEPRIIAEMGGIVYGPYMGRVFADRRETDIEHIVARSEAHDSGLCAADPQTRKRFASDLLNLTLASPNLNRNQKVAA